MFSDPQFWVAVAFVIFIIAIIKPVRSLLSTSLDNKINEIKDNIEEAENLKNDSQVILSEIKKRQNEVEFFGFEPPKSSPRRKAAPWAAS